MLTYESIKDIYRSILEKNPGKVMRQFRETNCGGEVAVLVEGQIYWASVLPDDSVSKYLRECCRNAWRNGGWYGDIQATQDAIDNPILLDMPNMDNHKLARDLDTGDMIVCPSGIMRRVREISRFNDRVCVVFTCNSDHVFAPGDKVEFQDPFGRVPPLWLSK